MKRIYYIIIALSLALFSTSCEDVRHEVEDLVEGGSSSELTPLRNVVMQYDVAKNYVDRSQNPNFKLGVGIEISEYTSGGSVFGITNKNFDEITIGYSMKHGAVVGDDGLINFTNIDNLMQKTAENGISIFGHTLTWHSNQNADYLNSLIADEIIPGSGGPTLEPNVVPNGDFEADDVTWKNAASIVTEFTADGQGFNGKGRALKVTNTVLGENVWNAQFLFRIEPRMAIGDTYEFSMDVRADEEVVFSSQVHGDEYSYKGGFIGETTATTEWKTITKTFVVETSEAIGGIVFDLGKTVTGIYFDNISMRRLTTGGSFLEPNRIDNSTFESDAMNWKYSSTITAVISENGLGAGGAGHALAVTNTVVGENVWNSQMIYRLEPRMAVGDTYEFSMDVRADAEVAFSSQVHGDEYAYKGGFIGETTATTEWKTITKTFTVSTAEPIGGIVFDLGLTSTTIYFDNVSLRRVNDEGGDQIIPKTDEEKRQIIGATLDKWISEMVTHCKEHVKAWDVVNEPMDDGNTYNLKTGIGKTLADDEFYWQDYLGKDYAVTAFNLAKQYGNANDILFINDYNLEYNIDKCKGLIEYVKYIESKGARVDGIGTQMHISLTTDKAKIAEMFQLLAATGKLVKVSELDVRMGVTPITMEQMKQQAEMYKYVVDMYFQHVPASQRYGITVWGVSDSPANANWLAGEQQALWDLTYRLKYSYKGFCDGLAGKEVFPLGQ